MRPGGNRIGVGRWFAKGQHPARHSIRDQWIVKRSLEGGHPALIRDAVIISNCDDGLRSVGEGQVAGGRKALASLGKIKNLYSLRFTAQEDSLRLLRPVSLIDDQDLGRQNLPG
jgi:hypothetical protein